MASPLDSKPGFGMAVVLGVAIGVMATIHLRDTEPPPDAPASAASWDGAVGPGALAAAPADSGAGPASAAAPAPVPDQAPLLDAAGRLVVDPALRRLFDSFLKNGAAGTPREQELRAHLKGRLGPPTLAQAEGLAGDYARYLKAEAALRANQRFVPPDPAGMSAAQVEQMLAWQQQRAQLRERMLGSAVSQAWFGTEDADCRTALNDWRTMRAPGDSEEVDSNELRARRLHGPVLEQRRNERAQSCAAQMMEDRKQ